MRLVIAAAIVLGLLLPACDVTRDDDGGVTIVASFRPLAEIAERLGGTGVEVVNLTTPGVEPHDLELTSDAIDEMEDAELVLYLGGGFQPAVEDAAKRLDH